jgi:AcrR family transcriptional regulator
MKRSAREKVLAAAEELFFEQGYDATSVREVVERAGVTKGALYHHFTSKEDLLYEMYMELFRVNLAGLERILRHGADPAQMLREIIDDLVVTNANSFRGITVAARELRRLDQERWVSLQADWRRYQDSVRKIIRDAQEQGVFATTASPEIISWSIFGFTNDLHTWYRPDGPKSAAVIAKELADFVLNGLAKRE